MSVRVPVSIPYVKRIEFDEDGVARVRFGRRTKVFTITGAASMAELVEVFR